MKIKIINQEQNELNYVIELRIEQELSPFNSINQDVTLSKADISHLSQDELYTIAYKKVKDVAIQEFTKVNKILNGDIEYVEEEANADKFTLMEAKHNSIEIVGINNITKEIGNSVTFQYTSIIKDQYGSFLKDVNIELKEEYDNVSLIDGFLAIGDFSGQITLKSSCYSLVKEFVIDVIQIPKVLTQEEIILTAIAELYEMQSQGVV